LQANEFTSFPRRPEAFQQIDSSIVRTHLHAAGPGRGGRPRSQRKGSHRRRGQRGGTAHFPWRCNERGQRSVDRGLYRRRNPVERVFNEMKHLRRVATRFDKFARNYVAATLLASARIGLNAYESTT